MPPSSLEVRPSSVHVKLASHETVKLATGGWFCAGGGGGVSPTSIVCVVELVAPSASVTVSVTVRGPACGYTAVTIAPVAVGSGNLPRSHAYRTTPTSSVDDVPSSVHVNPEHETVNRATGGWFATSG